MKNISLIILICFFSVAGVAQEEGLYPPDDTKIDFSNKELKPLMNFKPKTPADTKKDEANLEKIKKRAKECLQVDHMREEDCLYYYAHRQVECLKQLQAAEKTLSKLGSVGDASESPNSYTVHVDKVVSGTFETEISDAYGTFRLTGQNCSFDSSKKLYHVVQRAYNYMELKFKGNPKWKNAKDYCAAAGMISSSVWKNVKSGSQSNAEDKAAK